MPPSSWKFEIGTERWGGGRIYSKEVAARQVVGPLTPGEVPGLQTSPFGVISKCQPRKWRLIVDLSAPEGGSVNDGIDCGLCSLQYVSVEDIVHKV